MCAGRWLVVAAALALGCAHRDSSPHIPLAGSGVPAPNNVTVFSLGEAGYFCIKIPYLLYTQAGTLIAFAEARGKVSAGGRGVR